MPSASQSLGRALAALPAGGRLLRRAAGRGGAAVFMLHRVLPEGGNVYDPEMAVSVPAFTAFLDWLRADFEAVALEQLQARLRQRGANRGGRPLCALTFDDGWRDTFTHAFPALQRAGLPATVFLPLRFMEGGREFWQERVVRQLWRLRPLPDGAARLRRVGESFSWCLPLGPADLHYATLRAKLVRRSSPEAEAFAARLEEEAGAGRDDERAFMNWDEVRAMQAAGIVFASHTLNHALLSCAPPGEAEAELSASRRELSARLGAPVTAFSYPWGGLSPITRRQAAAAGYTCAVTTQPGWVEPATDPLRLPRIAISNAQLGWRPGRGFCAGGLQLQLARARRRPAPQPPAPEQPRLRVGILVDNPDAWGPQRQFRGGSELQLLRLLEALPPEHFEPELYFLRRPDPGLPQDWPWPAFAAAGAGSGPWAVVRGLTRLLRQRRPQLVQTVFADSLFLGVVASWRAQVPAILCARRNAGYWMKWYHRLALRLVNRMATSWQTNAPTVAQLLREQEHVPARGIEILPNWLDVGRFAPAGAGARAEARARLHLPADAFVAVCVANYRPVKDLTTLVAAAAVARERLPRLRLLLVGTGPEQPRLEREIARLGLGETVRLTGEQEHIEPYLAAADVGLLSSRSEGCSNAVLEYMAAGLPTVLSDIPANRALSTEGLFAPGDAAACAEELLRLADDEPLRAARGARNRRQAEAYGGEAFAARAQAHYLRAAGGVLRARG